MENEIKLKYGFNPHQNQARIFTSQERLPIEVLNGNLGYINSLDALNSWQLVKELRSTTNFPSAASFKHVSPSGAAIGKELSESLKKSYFVNEMELSSLATAYARARGTDRVSSFLDWIALSDSVDISCAELIRKEMSDGIIAPDYDSEALRILKQKKNGNFLILKIDPDYEPKILESRVVYGLTLEQERNYKVIDDTVTNNIVTRNTHLSEDVKLDLLIGYITLKYTQSNSICFTYDGQTIGVGAGQQSRVHCTLLAAEKAKRWLLRQHPLISDLDFKNKTKRQDKNNCIEMLLRNNPIESEVALLHNALVSPPVNLSEETKKDFLQNYKELSLASDGLIPFRDNIDIAYNNGVKYVIQPGCSNRDEEIIKACDDYGMVMIFTGIREFHH